MNANAKIGRIVRDALVGIPIEPRGPSPFVEGLRESDGRWLRRNETAAGAIKDAIPRLLEAVIAARVNRKGRV